MLIDGKPISGLPKRGAPTPAALFEHVSACQSPTEVGLYALEFASDTSAGQLKGVLDVFKWSGYNKIELSSGSGPLTFTTYATESELKRRTGRWVSVIQREKGFEVLEVRRDASDQEKPTIVRRENVFDESALAGWVQATCTPGAPCDGALVELRDETPAAVLAQLVQNLGPATRGGASPLMRIGTTPKQEPAERLHDLWVPSGRLPPLEIQKVVRSSFDAFRKCYEDGLSRDPKLQGRVVVRFVIGWDGRVQAVGDGGSDMPDKAVVACVRSGFGSLIFPKPSGGIVTVVYPIMFAPSP